jgi:AhpD family alkylhydroperoxidase
MTQRIQVAGMVAGAYESLLALAGTVEKAAADAGVDRNLLELVRIRASQLNGCAFCLDMHTADAVRLGESTRRLFVLDAWRETELFTEQERAALELTEVLTGLTPGKGLPDEVYARANRAFTDDQYSVVVWTILVINSWNRLAVPSRMELPQRS